MYRTVILDQNKTKKKSLVDISSCEWMCVNHEGWWADYLQSVSRKSIWAKSIWTMLEP